MARRRRRPALIFAVLFAFTACELDAVHTAMHLGAFAQKPWLAFALTDVFPLLAAVLALGPFIHIPTMMRGIKLPGWLMSGFLAPSYLFVLACAGYGFFGAIHTGVRALFGLRLRDVNWIHAYRRERFAQITLTQKGIPMLVEALVRLRDLGATFAEVDVEMKPRLGGVPSASRPRVMWRTLRGLLAFWFRWRRERRAA